VRCLECGFEPGPQPGWLGSVFEADHEDELFVVVIGWDALLGNRAERRRGGVPLHIWAFDSEELANRFLEVIPEVASIKNVLNG